MLRAGSRRPAGIACTGTPAPFPGALGAFQGHVDGTGQGTQRDSRALRTERADYRSTEQAELLESQLWECSPEAERALRVEEVA